MKNQLTSLQNNFFDNIYNEQKKMLEECEKGFKENRKKLEECEKGIEENRKMLEECEKGFEENRKELEECEKGFKENRKELEECEKGFRKMLEECQKMIDELFNRINNNSYIFPIKENSSGLIEELEIDEKFNHDIEIEKNKCIICLNNYKIHDKISYLPCLHLFHNGCIKEWLKRSNKCPLCKNEAN